MLPNPIETTAIRGTGNNTAGKVSVDTEPFPNVSAEVDIRGNGAKTAFAEIQYFVRVDGPVPGQVVQLKLESTNSYFSGGLVAFSDALAQSFVAIQSTPFNRDIINNMVFEQDQADPPGTYRPTAHHTTVEPILDNVGETFEVSVVAVAELGNSFADQSAVSVLGAAADPVISFAPGFDHTGMSIEVSPGVGNSFSSSVPEPSTLVICSILFGTWGAARGYRQLRRPRAAA